jgi:predicted nucleotidyltransferase
MNAEYTNKNLNPIIFDTQNHCYAEICEKLLLIAEQATHQLDPKLIIQDVLIVGSIANYNWNENSDIDLHIVIDFKDISDDLELVEKYLKLFKDKWNQEHNIEIRDIEVEISFQDTDATPTSNGQYSEKISN